MTNWLYGINAIFYIFYPIIDEIRICLESGLLVQAFYQFWALLFIKLYKIVNFISCFPYHTRKYEIPITLEFWQIWGGR